MDLAELATAGATFHRPATILLGNGVVNAHTPAGRKDSPRGELDWILLKALEKDRTRRCETANAFAGDILRLLDREPVEACPPSAVNRYRKFIQRNRELVAVLCS